MATLVVGVPWETQADRSVLCHQGVAEEGNCEEERSEAHNGRT